MNNNNHKILINTMPMQNANNKKYDYDYIREQIQTAISHLFYRTGNTFCKLFLQYKEYNHSRN